MIKKILLKITFPIIKLWLKILINFGILCNNIADLAKKLEPKKSKRKKKKRKK